MATAAHSPQTTPEYPLEIRGLRKRFEELEALTAIDLKLPKGQILALLGPSGCGKTTLLRCIAGLTDPSEGEIRIQGHLVANHRISVPPEARKLGMVFQDYALWPHMTVAENVAFPLAMERMPKKDRQERVRWALDLVGLTSFADRPPGTLSGGQQQRVALARAVVGQPRLLLMDEPLSNLDKGLRETLAIDIRRLIKELDLTAVFVTHDQQEAFALADQVAVLQQGQLQQLAPPHILYAQPAHPEICRFLDAGKLIETHLTQNGLLLGPDLDPLPLQCAHRYQGPVTVMVPRGAVSMSAPSQSTPDIMQYPATIQHQVFQGERYHVLAKLGTDISLSFYSGTDQVLGEQCSIWLNMPRLRVWKRDHELLSLETLTSASVGMASRS